MVSTFVKPLMLTLTVNPDLFGGVDGRVRTLVGEVEAAEAAYVHVRDRRGVSELVAALYKEGYLASKRFLYAVEWQKQGWPHWHLLLDSKKGFIPIERVRELWGKLRPKEAGAVPKDELKYPFGICHIRRDRFHSGAHAANYATKYLTKYPEEGFPAWVLDFRGQVHRYGTSRGFWDGVREGKGSGLRMFKKIAHRSDCLCEACCNRRELRSTRERVAGCGRKCVLYTVETAKNIKGSTVWRKFTMNACMPWSVVDWRV